MTRALRLFSLGVIASILLYANAFATCSGLSPNLFAASANRADVADCINASTYGDTINIPGCAAGSCVWTSQINITKDVKIVGAGVNVTYLTLGFTNNSKNEAFFKFVPDAAARGNIASLSSTNTIEVRGITFTGNNWMPYKFAIWIVNNTLPVIKRVNIHNNIFTSFYQVMGPSDSYVHGLFHSNTISDSCVFYHGGYGANSWANDRGRPGSGAGWYVEDNTATLNNVEAMFGGGNNDGGTIVYRYNTFSGTMGGSDVYIDVHSNQLAGILGGQFVEMYGNNFTVTGGVSRAAYIRGGQNIFFYNVLAAGGLDIVEEYGDDVSSATEPVGRCASNPGVSRQTCTDSCICQKVHDSYFVNNRRVAGTLVNAAVTTGSFHVGQVDDLYHLNNNVLNNPREVEENIEYFNHQTSFNGTAGVGCGTLANRPTTCTKGVGYWATTQSCSDLRGMVGAFPSAPISGTLYKCTATNTWAAHYRPYMYPHPLRIGSISLSSPSGIRVVRPQ